METVKKEKKTRNTKYPKFKSSQELQAKIDEYFAACDARYKPYTLPGLAYALGFQDKTGLLNYKHDKFAYVNTIKRALLKIETHKAEKLHTARNVSGIIFDLRSNFGWRDVTEFNFGGVEIIVKPEKKQDNNDTKQTK